MQTNILSLFDGISCAKLALDRAGIHYDNYYASEIDKYAIKVAKHNYPETIEIGDIKALTDQTVPKDIFLLVGGSPCQSLSIAARQKESGLEKGKSVLFWEYVRILQLVKPKYFLLENVASMKNTDRDTISHILGVKPIMINSALVSAQNRKRYYWTNIPNVNHPKDRGIMLKDILQKDVDKKYNISEASMQKYNIKTNKTDCIYQIGRGYNAGGIKANKCPSMTISAFEHNNFVCRRVDQIGNSGQGERVYSQAAKSTTLSSQGGGMGAKTGLYEVENTIRKLTPVECERLQTVPDNYTSICSDNQRYKQLGNGFTVDVISHILSFIGTEVNNA